MPNKKKNSNNSDLDDAIIACSQFYAEEDRDLRFNMLAYWRKLESYFQGFQRLYWDHGASDWRRVYDDDSEEMIPHHMIR